MPKIELSRLKKIIQEEVRNLQEGDDHDAASKQMAAATKLLKSVESFKESASAKVKAELETHLGEVQKLLNRVIASPMQYVDAVKPPTVKKVSLKPQKSNLV